MQTEARKRATLKYKKNHYKRVPLDIQREEYETIKEYAESNGETVNGMIKRLIRQEIGDATPEEKPKAKTKPKNKT